MEPLTGAERESIRMMSARPAFSNTPESKPTGTRTWFPRPLPNWLSPENMSTAAATSANRHQSLRRSVPLVLGCLPACACPLVRSCPSTKPVGRAASGSCPRALPLLSLWPLLFPFACKAECVAASAGRIAARMKKQRSDVKRVAEPSIPPRSDTDTATTAAATADGASQPPAASGAHTTRDRCPGAKRSMREPMAIEKPPAYVSGSKLIERWKRKATATPNAGDAQSAIGTANSISTTRAGETRMRSDAKALPGARTLGGSNVPASSTTSTVAQEVRGSRKEVVSFQNAAEKYKQIRTGRTEAKKVCMSVASLSLRQAMHVATKVISVRAIQHM
eukprot:6214566-Pleurochrysis_carterae.AAC.9